MVIAPAVPEVLEVMSLPPDAMKQSKRAEWWTEAIYELIEDQVFQRELLDLLNVRG